MTMTFDHVCSCGEKYTDNDPDLYFCPTCVEKRKALAKTVDAQSATRASTRTAKSDLQLYDEMCRVHGSKFVKVRSDGSLI